jgi:surfeit locus 1 family protein
VIAAAAVMARLGIWQLDRLAQRRAFNARVQAVINEPALELSGDALSADLYNMEYRQVVVTGEYDFTQQVALRNQIWQNQWGVHLLTPLHIAGTDQTILVDRGWIPGDSFEADQAAGRWAKYDEPGVVSVKGVIRRAQAKPDFGSISDPTPAPGQRLTAWNMANVDQISTQIPYHVLQQVYIQQAPSPEWTSMPYRSQPELDLSEGPHQGYAIQWFSFATILLLGYPFFVNREERASKKSPIESST